jgi:hypothetical protein
VGNDFFKQILVIHVNGKDSKGEGFALWGPISYI